MLKKRKNLSFDKVIIHIGRHKSGTSSIQAMLALNKEYFENKNVLYPQAGRVTNTIAHHELAIELKKTSYGNYLNSFLDQLAEEKQSHHKVLMLSSEAFQNIHDLESIKNLLKSIKYKNKIIICYVREYLDYAISSFRQKTQNQKIFDIFSSYVSRDLGVLNFYHRWNELGDFKAKWFGKDHFKEGNLIKDFLFQSGIEYSDELLCPRSNPSLGGNLLIMKMMANYLGTDFLSYKEMELVMKKHNRFTNSFHISNKNARHWRSVYGYNEDLKPFLGDYHEKQWSEKNVYPDEDLGKDFNLIKNLSGISNIPAPVKRNIMRLNTNNWLCI